ncbi:peptidoglycan DD-metalloendopeptidase family protein [Candidatus Dojkabacteria bacterium]|nr:peptidoglycan DD-metalloendopeptidase family protein [Candidatus Dojkabacteria bacterium]
MSMYKVCEFRSFSYKLLLNNHIKLSIDTKFFRMYAMNNSFSSENRKLAFGLLVVVVFVGLASVLIARERSVELEANKKAGFGGGSVQGIENKTSACDVMGLETGVEASVPNGDPYSEYYDDTKLAVVGTAVLPKTTESQIIEAAKIPQGKSIHMFRLGYGEEPDVFTPEEAVGKISTIVEVTEKLDVEVQIMPVNEPRTELSWVYGGNAPIEGSKWLKQVVDGLKSSNVATIANTGEYLVFPAFNYHNPNNANYISEFIGNYFGEGDKQLNGNKEDFANFALSIQYDTSSTAHADSFATMFTKYKQILQNKEISNVKYTIFGANQINKSPQINEYAENLISFINENIEEIDGVYIFSPWGWQGSNSANENLSIDKEVWDYLFEECSSGATVEAEEQSIKSLNKNIKNYASLETCEIENTTDTDNNVKGDNDDLFAGVSVTNGVAKPVITRQVSMSLLGWMGDNTLEGTSTNPVLAPCGVDMQIAMKGVDLRKKLPSLIELESENGETYEYPMSDLGNALACMIWRATNFEPGSESITDLEPRFSALPLQLDNVFNALEPSEAKNNSIPGKEYKCSGLINTVNSSDVIEGPEIIQVDKDYPIDFTRDQNILEGTYMQVDSRTYKETAPTEKLTIYGMGEALAQMYKEEYKHNPWKGTYQVIHRERGGIEVAVTSRLYDGAGRNPDEYSELYSTKDNIRTMVDGVMDPVGTKSAHEFGGVITGKSEGQGTHYIPWMEQTLRMMQRESLIFTDLNEDTYLKNRSSDIENMKIGARLEDPNLYNLVRENLLDPKKIYMCAGLDEVAREVARVGQGTSLEKEQEIIDLLSSVDCLGTKYDVDPLSQWLCQQDLLKGDYCTNECVPVENVQSPTVGTLDIDSADLIWPVESRRITQYYGETTYIGNTALTIHPGLDIGLAVGSKVYAVEEGEILYSRDPGETVTIGNGLYQDSSYGGLVVVDHGSFHSIYAHLNSANVNVGDNVDKGEVIGYSGNTGNSSGPHLHFELRVDNCYVYDSRECTYDPLIYLGDDISDIDRDSNVLDDYYEACLTVQGEEGYVSNRLLQDPFEGTSASFGYLDNETLKGRVTNICPISIGECDDDCYEEIRNWVIGLADFNRDILSRDLGYDPANYRTKAEIEGYMQEMYTTNRPDDISFPLLIAIWLAENGLNPIARNEAHASDIFGCGVFCEVPPQSFEEELACTTRRLDGCSVRFEFDHNSPGEYLERYGPIATNGTFTYEVIEVLEKLGEKTSLNVSRDEFGTCEANVYNPEIDAENILPWIDATLNYE